MRSLFIKGQKGHLEEKKGDIFLPASLLSSSLGKTAKIETQWRSEEHTSELQSQSNLVCRLLLEKKNNILKHPLASRRKNSTSFMKTLRNFPHCTKISVRRPSMPIFIPTQNTSASPVNSSPLHD